MPPNLKISDAKILAMISAFKYAEDLGFYLEITLRRKI